MFKIEVYNNTIKLQLSSDCVCKNFRQGNLILSLSKDDKISAFTIINLKEKERRHVIEELQFSKEERMK